jgi:putative transcription antitermination factor YqgF
MIPKTLAIDYGTVRVGVAVSRGSLADPLIVLSNTDTLVPVLKAIIADEEAELLLVGISENEMAKKTQAFVEKLRTEVSIPVFTTDETLSSKTVHHKLHLAKKSKRSGAIDHYAAAEFLQEWLDEKYG